MGAQSPANPWAYHPHPEVWVLVVALVGGYVIALRRLGGPGDAVTGKQKAAFAAAVALLWGFADWPMHDLSEGYLFSVHMVQHLVFSLGVAPLLWMGTPPWLLRRLVTRSRMGPVLRAVARPIPATLGFNAVVVLTHIPAYVNLSVRNEAVHLGAHTVLLGASMVMWLPVVNRLRELPTLSLPGSMLYLFVQSIVPTVPASFMAFATTPLYQAYIDAPHPWIGAVEDQQLAGAAMKVGGGMFLWGTIIYLFFRWYARSQSGHGDVLTWADVERELERAGPAPREITPSGT